MIELTYGVLVVGLLIAFAVGLYLGMMILACLVVGKRADELYD